MSINRKTLSGVLSLILCASMIGCAADEAVITETPGSDVQTEAETAASAVYIDDLPENLDFGGYSLRTYCASGNYSPAILSENGDMVNDLVYRRNIGLQERLNISLDTKTYTGSAVWDDILPQMSESVLSGSDDYDLICGSNWYTTALVFNGLLRDIADAPYVDTAREWWAGNYIKGMEYKGHRYFLAGPIEITYIGNTISILGNKKLWNDMYSANIHDMVREGRWTLDLLNKYTTEVYSDINGDGNVDEGDILGLCLFSDFAAERFVSGAGISITENDSEGEPVLAFLDDHKPLVEFWEKFYAIKTNSNLYTVRWDAENAPNTTEAGLKIFKNGNILFIPADITYTTTILRDMPDDYAILPLPKLNEEQKDYISVLIDQVAIYSVPKTVSDAGFDAGMAFAEAAAAYGYSTVIPGYIEDALKNKYIRDEESVETINMLIQNSMCDFGAQYIDLGFPNFIRYEVKGANIESSLRSADKKFRNKLAQMLGELESGN